MQIEKAIRHLLKISYAHLRAVTLDRHVMRLFWPGIN
jgi:hypothetical protein